MTDQAGVVAALDAEIIGEENAGYSAAHLKDIRDRVAELIAAADDIETNGVGTASMARLRAALNACKGSA